MTYNDILSLLPTVAIAWLPLLSALPAAMKGIQGLTGDQDDDKDGDRQMGALSSLLEVGTGLAGTLGGGGAGKAVVDGGAGLADGDTSYLGEVDDAMSSLDTYHNRRRA